MRKIEERILACLNAGKEGQYHLSEHDTVTISCGAKSYRLWGLELYYKSNKGIEYFYFSSRAADTPNCMSDTTASRMYALLRHTPCSIHRRRGVLYDQHNHIIHTDRMYKIVDGILVPSGWTYGE